MNSRRYYSLDKIMRAPYTLSQRKKRERKDQSSMRATRLSGPLDWLALGAGPRDTKMGYKCCVSFWFWFWFFIFLVGSRIKASVHVQYMIAALCDRNTVNHIVAESLNTVAHRHLIFASRSSRR